MAIFDVDGKVVEVTNQDKILFPSDNVTKADIIEYYFKIADYILPFLKDRPLTLNCYPEDIDNEGFYRQHAPASLPKWFKTQKLTKKLGGDIEHILCQNKASLVYLANQNTITFHRWLSKYNSPEYPDLIVIDLDPSNDDFASVCKGAKLLKDIIEKEGYKPHVMTTGSRGLHIVIPILEKITFEQAREIAAKFTQSLANLYPREFSTDIRKNKRKQAVYLDIMRNVYGQTAVSPFSVRAKQGAPIATPLHWSELDDKTLASNKYNISNIFKRLSNLSNNTWEY